jgi:threonine dehydrogenase-like Zn-dependent dehydrogenase
MKAIAVFPQTRTVRLVEHEAPAITSPTEVRLRMLEVGVCGTDKEICAFEYGTPPAGADHLVLGHESLGEVVEVGPAVARVQLGDLVVPTVRRPCPQAACRACQQDRQDYCFTGDFRERGIKEVHGYMAEFVVEEEKYLNRVPPELRDVAVLVEPLTIAEKALAQVRHVQQRLPWSDPGTPESEWGRGHRAVVLGAGPVGLLGALGLVAAGFDTYVYSRSPAPNPKADLAASFGGSYVSSESCSVEELARQVGNIDVIFEAVGASRMAFEVMQVLGTNGIFVFTGVPGRRGPIELDSDQLMRNLVLKNQVAFGTVNAGREAFEAAIRDLGTFRHRWPEAVRALISGRFPMTEYLPLLTGRAGGIKNVLTIG